MTKTNKNRNTSSQDSKTRNEAALVLSSINAGIRDADNGKVYTTSEARKLLKKNI